MKLSNWKKFKLFINLLLLTALSVILYQNNHEVEVELLFWEVKMSMTLMILGMALLGALITLIWVLIVGSQSAK